MDDQSPTGMALMEQLLNNQLGADVKFLVGSDDKKETFSAHKVILSAASPVFRGQFGGNFEVPADGIIVPDVEPPAFRLMLRYIYTSKMEQLTGDNVFTVLHTARKYDIIGLRLACVNFDYKFDPKNVLTVIRMAHHYDEELLLHRCFGFIDKNARDVLANLCDFPDLKKELLAKLLARTTLECDDEFFIFDMIKSWVEVKYVKHCCENGEEITEITKDNRRHIFEQMLGPALFQIRFPLIGQKELVQEIVPLDLLTKDELISVLIYHTGHATNLSSLPFPTKKRATKPLPPASLSDNAGTWGSDESSIVDEPAAPAIVSRFICTRANCRKEWDGHCRYCDGVASCVHEENLSDCTICGQAWNGYCLLCQHRIYCRGFSYAPCGLPYV